MIFDDWDDLENQDTLAISALSCLLVFLTLLALRRIG